MAIHRHFLSDTTPVLHQAVDWLHSRYPPQGSAWDLHQVIIAVPGRRSARRLTELLVERAGDGGLLTPTIVTAGSLPDELFEPTISVAADLQANLSWINAARDTAELTALLPHPPDDDDLGSWWSLAEQFRAIIDDLSTASVEPGSISVFCAGEGVSLPEPERWHALAAISIRHNQQLASRDLVERHAARGSALAEGRCRAAGSVILLGVLDMTPLLADMLRSIDSDVISLIHSTEDRIDCFDDLGALLVDAWHNQHIDVCDDRVHVVERPFDQGRQAVSCLAAMSSGSDPGLTADDITVGLGDEADVDAIRQALELSELPTRYAVGRPMSTTGPVRFLEGLARLADRHRFRDLADLLRHTDLEDYLHRAGGDQTDWMSLLDHYAVEHLPDRLGGDWLGEDTAARRLPFLWRCIAALMPEDTTQRLPLPNWSQGIRDALQHIYGHRTLSRESAVDAGVLHALQQVAALLEEHGQLDVSDTYTPCVTFTEAIDLLLLRLSKESVPEDGGVAAVEMLGFLELPLDDAPALVITGLNEGRVPQVRGPDPLLPDGLRRILGLDDNRRRYAHAACALHTILHTRQFVSLIAARWSADRDPLTPSRLLLACDQEARLRRLKEFYKTIGKDGVASPGPVLLVPGETSRFFPPLPDNETPLPDRLSVTAFRDFIACPYRFYLRRVCRLRAPDAPGDEMDGALFGTLAHDVLEAFGGNPVASSTDPAAIDAFLRQALDDAVNRRFGESVRPSVAVQLDQLRVRLGAFALKQADIVADGWRIHCVELNDSVPFVVDDEPFTLSGRVDRIDIHRDGRVRVIDYKTSDTALSPEKAHRRFHSEWLDLQLPLYGELIRPLCLEGPIELAYLNLPRRPEETGLSLADWSQDETNEAIDTAREIIRCIRLRAFWPPGDPARFPDEFVRLAADHALGRRELIQLATTSPSGSP
jgi:ATP-dependent helicase/nuclease subunit B